MTTARFRALAAACAGSVLGTTSPGSAQTFPADFVKRDVATGLTTPTCLEQLPDGTLLICEQVGTMEVWKDAARIEADFFADTPLIVNSGGEQGLIGLAIDPNFASNRFVYVYCTAATIPARNRIIRFTANAAGTRALAGSQLVVMELDNLGATFNVGGAMVFGQDGKLYVGVGDNAIGTNAQLLTNRHGKLLRINPDGSIPGDNPTFFPGIMGTPTGMNRAIWAVGLRNPFTLAVQPGTGRMHINDVGQNTWEEINLAAAGANYGWATVEGAFNTVTFPSFTLPVHVYGRTGPFGGFCVIGGAFYNPPSPNFPASYQGKYFFGDFISGWVHWMDASGSNRTSFATGVGDLVDIDLTRSGRLLFLRRATTGVVHEVRYMRGACCAGTACTNATETTCSASGFRPGAVCGPPGNPTACCPVNYDGMNGVSIDDIFFFLNGWLAQDPRADVDGANGVSIDDIFIFLGRWLIGC